MMFKIMSKRKSIDGVKDLKKKSILKYLNPFQIMKKENAMIFI